MNATLLTWITSAIVYGTVIMYGALGETLTQKSGNMNLGTPGVMCIGGSFGFFAAFAYELSCKAAGVTPVPFLMILLGLAAAFLSAALAGAFFCFLTTTLRANQNVTGLALTIFGVGVARFLASYLISISPQFNGGKQVITLKAGIARKIFSTKLPFYKPLKESITAWAGKGSAPESFWHGFLDIFFSYGFMMYTAIIIAVLLALYLKKTRTGLNLRAVGENPATADAAGINVVRHKYLSTSIGAGIAGLGGVYYLLDFNGGSFSTDSVSSMEALGWLSVALVIFALWRPLNLIWGSYLFGFCYWLYNYISAFGFTPDKAEKALMEAVPYVVTIILLIVTSVRKSKENQPPASLGLSYFREDR